MDNQQLRGIILKLQDCLSDSDRQRLHFFLGDEIPRPIRDDPTLNGTLRLMESLFDQDKINERDFTFLINAFNAIQCVDAVKLLNEHTKQMQTNWLHGSRQSLSTTISSFIDQVILDQEDKNSAQTFFFNQKNNCSNNNKIINSNNTNINPLTITIDNKKILSSCSKRNQVFYISSTTKKYFFFMLFFLMIAFGILVGLFLIKNKEINEQAILLKQKNDIIYEERRQFNRTIQQLNQQREKMKTEKPRIRTLLISPGKKFGSTSDNYFDDSLLSDFNYHYLSGIIPRGNHDTIDSYQFVYSSDDENQNPIESHIHGNQDSMIRNKFICYKGEKIKEATIHIINETVLSPNGTNVTSLRIAGLEFVSTDDRASPFYSGRSDQNFIEKIDGYILGYVTGGSNQYINYIQFFWYREEEE